MLDVGDIIAYDIKTSHSDLYFDFTTFQKIGIIQLEWTEYNFYLVEKDDLFESERYEALECYDKAIELDPNNADAWVKKGQTLEKLRKYKDAMKCYEKAYDIKPTGALLFTLALMRREFEQGRWDGQKDKR